MSPEAVVAPEELNRLKEGYDVAIIGGGIHGCAALWEAASRGLRAVLFESGDFCSGTSANSLKVIHGGLRYLQSLNVSRSWSSVREASILRQCAPHLVAPLRCVVPVRGWLADARPILAGGLLAYDLMRRIACPRGDAVNPVVPASRVLRWHTLAGQIGSMVPGAELAMSWYDAQAYSTERLALAFLHSAESRGADAFNYAPVEGIETRDGRVAGLRIGVTGEKSMTVRVACVVDCTGPWAAKCPWVESVPRPAAWMRALNIVVPRQWLSVAVGVPMPNDSSRMMFAAPWREGTLVGTWYYPATDGFNVEEAAGTAVREVNAAFPHASLRLTEVSLVHCGLLPALATGEGRLEIENSGRVTVALAGSGALGFVRVQGVKYTTARAVAVEAIDSVVRHLGYGTKSRTHLLPLVGAGCTQLESMFREVEASLDSRVPVRAARRIVRMYGEQAKHILVRAAASSEPDVLVPGSEDTLRAELEYAIENERVWKLSDLILRRTDLGTLRPPASETVAYCAEILGRRRGWATSELAEQVDELWSYYPSWCRPAGAARSAANILEKLA